MRYDLAFFLCCCKSFLSSSSTEDDDFYGLLGIERDASPEEIKRAYKKKSLQMHPDKLAQRGLAITQDDQAKFQRMKEAYECLRDPHKRETYDAIGAKGMKWLEEPLSMDPQELAQNFVTASLLDRSKIFAIFVGIVVVILYLPVVICLHVDGVFGEEASWTTTLIPLWLFNALMLFYYSRILAFEIPKPEDVPEEDWVDPFPMHVRILSLIKFLLMATFEVFLALKLDTIIDWSWGIVFLPLLLWEATNLYQEWTPATLRIVTVAELEEIVGKSLLEMTPEERNSIAKQYKVVSSHEGSDADEAHELRAAARQQFIKTLCRMTFMMVLILQFDTSLDMNWWILFLPFWISIFLVCAADYQAFAKVKLAAVQKDPELFGFPAQGDEELGTNSPNSNVDYGSVGNDGAATPAAAAASSLTPEEKEKLKEEVVNSGSKLCTQCCGQGFTLLILCLIVGKLQGAGFSTLWLISPILFAASLILCCLGIAIFGVSEVPDAAAAAYESEVMVNPTTDYHQAPIATTEEPMILEETAAEPKINEGQTTQELSSTARASDESHSATEIRELD